MRVSKNAGQPLRQIADLFDDQSPVSEGRFRRQARSVLRQPLDGSQALEHLGGFPSFNLDDGILAPAEYVDRDSKGHVASPRSTRHDTGKTHL
jgi:hypothetical protein